MGKFLFIYRAPTDSGPKMSPEEMQTFMVPWREWFEKFGSAILDGGDGLLRTGRVLTTGLATDGPYVEAKEIVGGYTVVQAEDYEAATAIAKECPVLRGGGRSIEIREFAGFN